MVFVFGVGRQKKRTRKQAVGDRLSFDAVELLLLLLPSLYRYSDRRLVPSARKTKA